MCRSQAEHLAAELDLPTMAYATTFLGAAGGANRCEGGDYGLAVMSSLPAAGDPFELPLPNPGLGRRQLDERKVACVPLRWRDERLVACTSHLVRAENDAEAHEQQTEALPQQLLSLDEEHVVVGVDLNDEAAALGPARARFRTAGHGVDHVLATRSTFADLDVERRGCDCSDHDALVAALRV